MAPEVIMSSLGIAAGYDHRVDWFSLGVCFYEMLMGRRPYEYNASLTSQQVSRCYFSSFRIILFLVDYTSLFYTFTICSISKQSFLFL